MSGGGNSEIKEHIDTDKNFSIDMNEINNFIFDEKEGTNNLNELGNYLNGLLPMELGNDIIRRALMIYFTSKEWGDISKGIEEKVNSNRPLEKKEITLLYLQMVNISSPFKNSGSSTNSYSFDPNKPIGQICGGKLLTFIRTSYNNKNYSPEILQVKNITNNFQNNQNKDKYGVHTGEIPTNIEIPKIPELKEDNLDYVHNYCFKLMDWAKENFSAEVNRICYDAGAKHYDQKKEDIPEFARYDVLLFAYEKYCEIISKNHENIVKGAGYKDVKEFEQQVDELNKFSEEVGNKFPNLEKISAVLQKFSQELEDNRNKYFKDEEEVDKARKESGEFNDFAQKKSEEYKIDEIVKSFEKNPENKEEAKNYFEGMNILLEYQNELNEKSESYGGNIEKYQQYIQGNIEISKRYPQIKEYIEIQQQYSEFLKSWGNKIDFEKIQKYNELRENTGIDKDFNNMSVLGKVILDPTNEYFPIIGVKNAQAEKEKKIDTFRNKLEKNFPLAYWTLNTISGLWNNFIAGTASIGTSLGYIILSLCGKDKSDLLKRKQFYDSLLTINRSSKQKEAIFEYDSSTHSFHFNFHSLVPTVAGSISQMFCLIYGGGAFAKGIGKITGISTKIAGKAGLFSFAFIDQIGQSYVEANLNGLEGGKAFAYSALSAFVQGSLELVSPNEMILGKGSSVTKELIKELAKDGSKESLIMLGKTFLKDVGMEIIEENLQEALQLTAGNLINMRANNKYDLGEGDGTKNFDVDWTWENFAQTVIITTLTTGIVTGSSHMANVRNISQQSKDALFNQVLQNEETYTSVMEMLDKAIDGKVKIPNVDVASLQQLKNDLMGKYLSATDNYFNGKSHKFEITESQARSNSETMDNILNEVNEQNKSEKLNELRNQISEQYKQATGEEIELNDEQLLSILDAHEQDGVLGELTKPQLTQKVRTLSESITDSNIRRFLLEAGFCGSIFGYSFKNIFNKSEKYSIGQQVSILTKSDNSIVYDAYIKSFNQGIGKYMVTRYQNGRLTGGRFSAQELNSVGQLHQKDNFTEKVYPINQQELRSFYSYPQTQKSQIFLDAGFLPRNKIILGNSTLYITDKIIDITGRPIIIGYTMEGGRFNLRLFYRSMSEGCRRACPGIRPDSGYSKGEGIPNASYETTTKLNPKIGDSFDNLTECRCGGKPIFLSLNLGTNILLREMRESTAVTSKLFPSLQGDAVNFYKNKNSSLVIDGYKKLVPDGLNYEKMSYNRNEGYSYQHDYLGEVNVQVCSTEWNGKRINVHFAHAKDSPNKVRIDNIVYSDAKINSFGIYDKQINAGPLVAKPIDYSSQVPTDFKLHKPIGGSTYIDIRDLYQENPIIKRYKKKILGKKMYS